MDKLSTQGSQPVQRSRSLSDVQKTTVKTPLESGSSPLQRRHSLSASDGLSGLRQLTSSETVQRIGNLLDSSSSSDLVTIAKEIPDLDVIPRIVSSEPLSKGHQPWVKGAYMEKFITDLGDSNKDKQTTLLQLNHARSEGKIPGDTLLYMGAGGDVEHPLFTTNAKEIHFVDSSSDNLDSIRDKFNRMLDSERFELVETSDSNGKHTKFSIVDKSNRQEQFSLSVHKEGYDSYLSSLSKPFDIIMDKDSWLGKGGWKEQEPNVDLAVAESILPHIKPGGLWMGGYGVEQPMAQSFLDQSVTDLTPELVKNGQQSWSGYEKMQIRQVKSDVDLTSISESVRTSSGDEVWTKIENNVLPYINQYSSEDTPLQHNYENIQYVFDALSSVGTLKPEHLERIADHVLDKNKVLGTITREQILKDLQEAIKTD